MDRAMIAAALLYLLILLGIGFWSLRRTGTSTDFFLAGRRLTLLPAALAAMASIMSGFVFVGGPGLFYSVGLSSVWIIISGSFTGAMMTWVLARPLNDMARRHNCLTIPDVILFRFRCRFSSGLAALGILLGVLGYLATQLRALGVMMSAALPVSMETGLLLAVGILVFYSAAGGMVAAVYTDILQGLVMLFASIMIFWFALQAGGGLERISSTLLEHRPEAIHPLGTIGALGAFSWFFVFAVGALGQPHVLHKFMMIRDLRALRFFPLILAVSMMVCGFIWIGGGMAVTALTADGRLPVPDHPDQAITLLLQLVPPWLGALAYAGALSAIMSTADSFVNIGAGALARDLPRAFGRTLDRELLWARLFSILLFGVSLIFALNVGHLVAYLGIFGFGMFAAALTPVLTLGLNWKEANRRAAQSSIAFGVVAGVGLEALSRYGYYSLEVAPAAVALALSFLVFLAVGCRPGSAEFGTGAKAPSGGELEALERKAP
jgi:SSS family transporter